jgi:RND family efflux transporter MFP subunit
MTTERALRAVSGGLLAVALLLGGCQGGGEVSSEEAHGHDHGPEGDSWSVTAWGEGYEVFPEVGALTAGETAQAHVHVTVLDGFRPMEQGEVLVSVGGETFGANEPIRPGIYEIGIAPTSVGEHDLTFTISGPAGRETLRAGRVRVGEAGNPGRLVRAPAPRGGTDGAEAQDFTKEQQWKAPLATDWVRQGPFSSALEGSGTLRPVAGGEGWITAPVGGRLATSPWPMPGRELTASAAAFRIAPAVASSASLPALEAELAVAREESSSAAARLERLEALLAVEATSQREVDEARTRVQVAEARRRAASLDLSAARSARQGTGGGETTTVRAPFTGQVARIDVSPGATVEQGERLARLVRTDRVWVEVALDPAEVARARAGVTGLVVDLPGGAPVRFSQAETTLVSFAPEVDGDTGKLPAIFEVPGRSDLPLGVRATVRLLLAEETTGVVLPEIALVDDGGVDVVYLQLSGERFVRQQVEVVSRQGDRVLVEGLTPGQRVVTRGGDAIRRAGLLATGGGHGHVH